MLQIIITDASGKQRKERLGDGTYTIGRKFFADFTLADKSIGKSSLKLTVSKGQCRVQSVSVEDNFEFNGVSIPVAENVLDDDLIVIGKTRIQFSSRQDSKAPVSRVQSSAPIAAPVEPPVASRVEEQNDGLEETYDGGGYLERIEYRKTVQEQVQQQLDKYQRENLNDMHQGQLRSKATQLAHDIIQTRRVQIPANVDQQILIEEVVSESIGYGPLEPLLADNSVTEIMVNGFEQIYAERRGRLQKTQIAFINRKSLMAIIERIVSPLRRRIDEGSPLVDARLPDGSRVNAIIEPLSLVGPVLTIRKFSKQKMCMDDLVQGGGLSRSMADFLEFCVMQRKSIVVSGGTGSGKTTFLNALSESIPSDERIMTIEDAAELQLKQDHVVSLESRPPNVEGEGEVTIRKLMRNALRMRPDRIIVGECRDGAALDMLQAMNTGHDGSLTTGHANSPRDLLARLEVMCLMSEIHLPSLALREQIASAVDIIVQQERFKDGSRRVTSIVEVVGMEGEVISLNKLFEFQREGVDNNGKIVGHYASQGQLPQFYSELEEAGVAVDRSLFLHQELPLTRGP